VGVLHFSASESGLTTPKSQANESLKAKVFILPGMTVARDSRFGFWSIRTKPQNPKIWSSSLESR